MSEAARHDAKDYREASEFTEIRRPSVICYVTDETQSSHRGSGVSGFGWRQAELADVDLATLHAPEEGFALLDDRIQKILNKEIGIQWKSFNCAEVKALNNLLKQYPDTELNNVVMASYWISDYSLAPPCKERKKWGFKYLKHVESP